MNFTFIFPIIFSWLLWGEVPIKPCSPAAVSENNYFEVPLAPPTSSSPAASPLEAEEIWKAEKPIPIVNKANCKGMANNTLSSIHLQFLKERVS